MRENMGLYCGKRMNDGSWVFGCLLVYGNRCFIIPSEELIESEVESRFYWHLLEKHYEVLPETVGQYTGHTDMKRKKIFEGDIIQRYKTEFNPPRKYKNPYVVHIKSEFPRAVEEYYSAFEHFSEKVGYKVIGNIHDNPELLEVSK